MRLYAQEHISEEELETYLLDLKHQIDNLRLLIESAQADLSRSAEKELAAKNTEAWLLTLRDRIGLREAPRTREAAGGEDRRGARRERPPPGADNLPFRPAETPHRGSGRPGRRGYVCNW